MDLSRAEKIYEGKFSIVYKIQKNGSVYILKQLHPRWKEDAEVRRTFKKEAVFTPPPGIAPRVLDVVEQNDSIFLVREYIPGITLRQLHKRYTRKKYHRYYALVYRSLLDKLCVLHYHGIIHGDIKPSNILISGDQFEKGVPEVYLLDLGLAFEKNKIRERTTQNALHFSMWYGAPELMLNAPSYVDEHTDIFSLGICMYESFSGEFPYRENHPAVLLQKMLAVPLVRRKKIPAPLNSCIDSMCLKPAFTKPAAYYTQEEISGLLRENIEERKTLTKQRIQQALSGW